MVTMADADCDESTWEVAVTITVAGDGIVAGAVYKPAESRLPHADPEQPAPLRLQIIAVSELPMMFVRNCCCPFKATTALAGEIVIATGAIMVTVATDDFVESAADIAFTIT
jgi:hypothetical protein